MPTNIIKDQNIVANDWQLVDKDATAIPTGKALLPLSLWQANSDNLKDGQELGIWLDSDESPQMITEDVNQFAVIAINFPAFADGRGFSYGRELREQHGFTGELRAIGGFIPDQLYYLSRCGFNAFALDGFDLESALTILSPFTDSYQAAVDQPIPLFNRR